MKRVLFIAAVTIAMAVPAESKACGKLRAFFQSLRPTCGQSSPICSGCGTSTETRQIPTSIPTVSPDCANGQCPNQRVIQTSGRFQIGPVR